MSFDGRDIEAVELGASSERVSGELVLWGKGWSMSRACGWRVAALTVVLKLVRLPVGADQEWRARDGKQEHDERAWQHLDVKSGHAGIVVVVARRNASNADPFPNASQIPAVFAIPKKIQMQLHSISGAPLKQIPELLRSVISVIDTLMRYSVIGLQGRACRMAAPR